MKKKMRQPRPRPSDQAASFDRINAAIDEHFAKEAERVERIVRALPEIDPATKAEWDARMAARQKITDSYNGRPPYGLCY